MSSDEPLPPARAPATLDTEAASPLHANLDRYTVSDLVNAFIDDQARALRAVSDAAGELAAAVTAAAPRVAAGGRLVYVGAGTSGRLGVLDSVELFPTFSWPRPRALAVLAGGPQAMFESVEGAEDNFEQGGADVRALALTHDDVAILIAASGTTPYVLGALAAARDAGALTIAIANNPGTPLATGADLSVTLHTGNEIISGSTRLKAATAQKVALNTLSSAIMVRLNKVYGNLMVDVQPSNAKLLRRALSLTMQATGCDEATARDTLAACGQQVKVAIVAIALKTDVGTAAARLATAHGSVRQALS